MSDSPVSCTIDPTADGKQAGMLKVPRSSNTAGWSNLWIPIVSVGNGAGPTVLVIGGRPRRRAGGPDRGAQSRPDAAAGARDRPRDRDPVRLAGGLARLHAPLALGREPEPLVPGLPDRPGRRAARPLPLDRALPDLGRDRRHPQRRPQRAPPSLVRDALGRRRGAAAADGRRDARVEHRLVLRLHRHRGHRPARHRGGAPGEDRRQHRARRRRPRHRGDPPPCVVRARERAPARAARSKARSSCASRRRRS